MFIFYILASEDTLEDVLCFISCYPAHKFIKKSDKWKVFFGFVLVFK